MTTVIFCDPSSKPKNRGYSAWQDGNLVAFGAALAPLLETLQWARVDIAAVEDQWVNPKVSRQSLITLGQYAGFLLGCIPAVQRVAVPVRVWKDRVIPGFANAPKEMYTNNLRQIFVAQSAAASDDVIDAIAGGASFWTKRGQPELAYTKKQLKDWSLV